MADLEDALVSVIRHCPNLEIFIVDWPMGETFGAVADALATYTVKSLRVVQWHVPSTALPKVIWALSALPYIIAGHIHFGGTPDDVDSADAHLGSASDVNLSLPHLQQLSLRGHCQEFVEQAAGWSIPLLKSVTIDCGSLRTDMPDIVTFLKNHGARLYFLDINCIPPFDVPVILDLCPMLSAFCFNADWRTQQPGAEVPAPISLTMTHATDTPMMSKLVNDPHPNISMIGLHGLMYAFGVGVAASVAENEPLMAHIIRHSNDLNMTALNKHNFPKLQFVRAVSWQMLSELNEADGPSAEDGGMMRYDQWWDMLTRAGIQLEDCTGQPLGTLPMDEEEDESDSDDDKEGEDEEEEEEEEYDEGEYEDSDEYEDDDDDEWEIEIPPLPQEGGGHVDELRQLLEECRAMAEEREEPMFPPMMFGGMMAMGPP
jgi:hypothetical protein